MAEEGCGLGDWGVCGRRRWFGASTPHLTSPLEETFEKVLSDDSQPHADQIGQRSPLWGFPDFFKGLWKGGGMNWGRG